MGGRVYLSRGYTTSRNQRSKFPSVLLRALCITTTCTCTATTPKYKHSGQPVSLRLVMECKSSAMRWWNCTTSFWFSRVYPDSDETAKYFQPTGELHTSRQLTWVGMPKAGSIYVCPMPYASIICMPYTIYVSTPYASILSAEQGQCLRNQGIPF